jgi:hypothetical protein
LILITDGAGDSQIPHPLVNANTIRVKSFRNGNAASPVVPTRYGLTQNHADPGVIVVYAFIGITIVKRNRIGFHAINYAIIIGNNAVGAYQICNNGDDMKTVLVGL